MFVSVKSVRSQRLKLQEEPPSPKKYCSKVDQMRLTCAEIRDQLFEEEPEFKSL